MTLQICENRQRILDATGHVLVTGGPGCGKTTIALHKALSRIEMGLEPGQKVLFLSFSRAAVSRILEAARHDLPHESRQFLEIQTFHSFHWQLIRGHGYLLGAPRNIRIMLPHDERALRNGARGNNPAWDAERNKLFHEHGLLAFDLFAPKALALLRGSDEIRRLVAERYPLIIVDEAQDTGTDQWNGIEALSDLVQLVCLADLEQQIFDFRPDISAERLSDILRKLDPEQVELGTENLRSPGAEIICFGNDILANTPRGSGYEGIAQFAFRSNAELRDRAIRQSIGIVSRLMEERTGGRARSIAALTNWGKGVAVIARALQGSESQQPIPHKVVMDEAEVLLATRVIGLCLEPVTDIWSSLAAGLDLLVNVYRARGNSTKADQLQRNAQDAREGRLRGNARAPRELKNILEVIKTDGFKGNPGQDWLDLRRKFSNSGVTELKHVANQVVYLMGFNRGRRIADSLADSWLRFDGYVDARQIIEAAITEDQVIGGDIGLSGINVMTMHKSKGKEFDAVIVFHLGHISPLSHPSESPPYTKSRKLLRVAVTRARHQVLMVTDVHNPSPLLEGHRL